MATLRVFLVLTLLGGQWVAALLAISFEDLKLLIGFLGKLIKLLSAWVVPAAVYVLVFVVTLIPAGLVLIKFIKALDRALAKKSLGAWIRFSFWALVFIPVWNSPTISLVITGRKSGIPWNILLIPVVILLAASTYTVYSRFKRRGSKKEDLLIKRTEELLLVALLLLAEKVLKVTILQQDDEVATRLISGFRGLYITWAGDKSSQAPNELDTYDFLPSTVHIGVFLNGWLIGYGRLLFGCQQLLIKYRYLLGDSYQDYAWEQSVEVSRLLVVPKVHGFAVRGSILSILVQLLIYRKFFKICEDRQVTQWWAVLGPGLLRLLRMYDFPFERVNQLEGRDEAGRLFAVKMEVGDAKLRVKEKRPLLYRWFVSVKNGPEMIMRLNGNNSVPPAESFQTEASKRSSSIRPG